jgi:hypothetical protein
MAAWSPTGLHATPIRDVHLCSAGGLSQSTRTSTPSQKIVLKAIAIMMPEP